MSIYFNNTEITQPTYNGVTLTEVYYNGTKVWPEQTALGPLCLTANTAGSSVSLSCPSTLPIANTSYSLDGVNWNTYTSGTTITLSNAGDKVYFRNDILGDFTSEYHMRFYMEGSINASGNINSMYDSVNYETLETLVYKYCFAELFYYYTNYNNPLKTAPSLPAKTLSEGCYSCTFYNSAIVVAPDLPATTLAKQCYFDTFFGCKQLTTAPKISAVNMVSEAFMQTFYACTALTTVPKLPATNIVRNCYQNMFGGCTSLHVSTTQTASAPYAWTIPESGVFAITERCEQSGMFGGCLDVIGGGTIWCYPETSNTYYTQNPPV